MGQASSSSASESAISTQGNLVIGNQSFSYTQIIVALVAVALAFVWLKSKK